MARLPDLLIGWLADGRYAESMMAKGLQAHLNAHSAVLAPRQQLEALLDAGRTDAYADVIRTAVPQLLPRGLSSVVLHFGSAMGLLPLLSMAGGGRSISARRSVFPLFRLSVLVLAGRRDLDPPRSTAGAATLIVLCNLQSLEQSPLLLEPSSAVTATAPSELQTGK